MGNKLCSCGEKSTIRTCISYICDADVPNIKLLHKYNSFRCQYPTAGIICDDDIKEISQDLGIKLTRPSSSEYNQYYGYCCEKCFKLKIVMPFEEITSKKYYEIIHKNDRTYVIDFIFNDDGFFQK
jgi:hypothetical protein